MYLSPIDLGLATSGPDVNQVSSAENSSFHTDDEKDTGGEIATLYPTAALDIKLNNSFQDWENGPCLGQGLAIVVPTVAMLSLLKSRMMTPNYILQVHVNLILGLVQADKAVSLFYVRQLLFVAEQNLQDELEPIFIYQSILLIRFIIGQLFMDRHVIKNLDHSNVKCLIN